MGFFADLFRERTYTCESCQAHKHTIILLTEEVEYLRGLLDREHEKTVPPPPAQPIKPGFEGNIRKSRIPWSRKQAALETASAREAAEQEKAAWARRVEAAEKADVPKPS